MPGKGGEIVPIRWNAKRVKESTDMLEEALRKAVDPLEEARLIAGEALSIPELPLYIGQNFMNLIGKIDDSAGGGSLRYFHALRRIQNFF
jgi:hypothetical protein